MSSHSVGINNLSGDGKNKLFYIIMEINVSAPLTHTCHAMALHATHFVLSFQRGQQGSPDGDAIHHSAELENNWFLLQAFRKLRELISFYRGLIDAGCFVGGLRGGSVLPIRRLTVGGGEKNTQVRIHSLSAKVFEFVSVAM